MPGTPARDPALIACDLDGTLLDYEAAPVPGAGAALAELVAAGALFVVCTGRPLQAARRATATLGVEPVVFACYHGALIAEASGRILRHLPLPRPEARTIAAEALAAGVAVTVWDVDEPRELEPDSPAPAGLAAGLTGGRAADLEPGDHVSRLVIHGEPATVARLFAELRAEWAGRLRVEPIRPGFLGVFAPGVDKGDALRFVAGRLGVPPRRMVACGDGRADETMLAAAAVRVAVGESPHLLGHLQDVVVTSWAGLPDTLRAQVLPLL
jgi:Cof subfamily protein (haloacid dehalogenase superfamily)